MLVWSTWKMHRARAAGSMLIVIAAEGKGWAVVSKSCAWANTVPPMSDDVRLSNGAGVAL